MYALLALHLTCYQKNKEKTIVERNRLLLEGKEGKFVKISMVTFQLITRFHEPYSSHKGGKSQVPYGPT